MKKYEKLPVIVEAIRVDKALFPEIRKFLGDSFIAAVYLDENNKPIPEITDKFGLIIETLEGEILATEEDFILKGVRNEFYPCKADIFYETYKYVGEVE